MEKKLGEFSSARGGLGAEHLIEGFEWSNHLMDTIDSVLHMLGRLAGSMMEFHFFIVSLARVRWIHKIINFIILHDSLLPYEPFGIFFFKIFRQV